MTLMRTPELVTTRRIIASPAPIPHPREIGPAKQLQPPHAKNYPEPNSRSHAHIHDRQYQFCDQRHSHDKLTTKDAITWSGGGRRAASTGRGTLGRVGTGWLVTLTVVWFLAAAGTGLWYLAMMNDPAGQSLPDGAMGCLAGGGAILLIYGVPLWLGVVAHQRGASGWIWLIYLLPHVLTGLFATAIFVSGVRADRAWKRAGIRPPGRRRE